MHSTTRPVGAVRLRAAGRLLRLPAPRRQPQRWSERRLRARWTRRRPRRRTRLREAELACSGRSFLSGTRIALGGRDHHPGQRSTAHWRITRAAEQAVPALRAAWHSQRARAHLGPAMSGSHDSAQQSRICAERGQRVRGLRHGGFHRRSSPALGTAWRRRGDRVVYLGSLRNAEVSEPHRGRDLALRPAGRATAR